MVDDLIPAARRAKVLDLLKRKGAISIHALAGEIGTSVSTARRDVDFLTAAGFLERSHGGAQLSMRSRTTFEPTSDIAEQVAHSAKLAIGRHAANLVEEGQSVILDSSSTVLEAAHALVERRLGLTVVTNDLRIAMAMRAAARVQLIVPGGQVRGGSFTLIGTAACATVRTLHADIAFIGVHSLSHLRASETAMEVASIKRCFIEAANRVYLLVDSSKFQQPAFCEICPVELFHEVICDDGISPDDRRGLEQRGIRVTQVKIPKAP
jgi:DeoR family transcriptional regulator of aga operon